MLEILEKVQQQPLFFKGVGIKEALQQRTNPSAGGGGGNGTIAVAGIRHLKPSVRRIFSGL